MIYTEKTKRALKLCYKAHAGQVDKSGLPYFHHPFHLAEQMDDKESTIVALLHDVVEDAGDLFPMLYLESMGFGDIISDIHDCFHLSFNVLTNTQILNSFERLARQFSWPVLCYT